MAEFSILTKELLTEHLAEIINEVKDFSYEHWQEENYTRELADKWKLSTAVFVNGGLAGFSVNSNKNAVFHIHFFHIFKKYRNKKIGELLINLCAKTSLENNIKTMQLKCHKDNFKALNFFFNNGFHIKKIDENKNNLYLMEKILI
jgi:ribosomal protein S18 acetylase RimI-like enzyme